MRPSIWRNGWPLLLWYVAVLALIVFFLSGCSATLGLPSGQSVPEPRTPIEQAFQINDRYEQYLDTLSGYIATGIIPPDLVDEALTIQQEAGAARRVAVDAIKAGAGVTDDRVLTYSVALERFLIYLNQRLAEWQLAQNS